MHQSKDWDNWKYFIDAENTSKVEHRKIASVKLRSRDLKTQLYGPKHVLTNSGNVTIVIFLNFNSVIK